MPATAIRQARDHEGQTTEQNSRPRELVKQYLQKPTLISSKPESSRFSCVLIGRASEMFVCSVQSAVFRHMRCLSPREGEVDLED